ncbi:hypothetical protein MSP8887_00444 [Marinomonas spartinae]|uniref:Uncharacterized protein n=1 Tax=Marinomonas spartinae TaxID=1792290 RepID=A0A1A8TJ62_9GAMM|nr:hypothetical protein [Marinomonas spartinae]SBS26582.1 hypothetical protein MSP8887_00444 [Marinomonas spartinae]SBS32854.1 hypothetical protein MSP8886_02572 [Marinomonas spartinae]
MTTKTVADALHIFYELNSTFADAYWETNDINQKDRFFAMKMILQDELDELHKLSMQDHIYPYESINLGVLQLSDQLKGLLPDLNRCVLRPQTRNRFIELIPSACTLFES